MISMCKICLCIRNENDKLGLFPDRHYFHRPPSFGPSFVVPYFRLLSIHRDGNAVLLYRFLRSMLPFAMLNGRAITWKRASCAVAAMVLAYAAMRSNMPQAPSENTMAVTTHAAKMGPFSFVQTRDGVRELEVEADRGETEDGKETVVENVRLSSRPSQGVGFRLRADRGRINLATRNFSLQQNDGQIAVVFDNGYTVAAPALHWQEAMGVMTATGPVLVQGRNVRLTGRAMSVDQRTQMVVVDGGVEAIVY